MYKILGILLLGILIPTSSINAQLTNIEQLLQTIESNNSSLIVYRSYMEGEILKYYAENRLPDLQTSGYYLPFGNHNSGDYTEFEISQQFEFPTVYSARTGYIEVQKIRLEFEYQKVRQEVLLKAKKLSLQLIFLRQNIALSEERISQSQKVFEQIQSSYENGQTGILELNKAKIVLLDQEISLEELFTQQRSIEHELQGLNGGQEISLELDAYPFEIEVFTSDNIWAEKYSQDPEIALLDKEVEVAKQQVSVARNQRLPSISAGFNYQGVQGEGYSGFFGGISIPLWSSGTQQQIAEARVNYFEIRKTEALNSIQTAFTINLHQYLSLLSKYEEYQIAMQGLNSEMLLHKAYELGEISFLNYYQELSFYREAEDRMLEIENELHQLQAELLKHQL